MRPGVGIKAIVAKLISLGIYEASGAKTEQAVCQYIDALATSKYNDGITYADNRENIFSVSYANGYQLGEHNGIQTANATVNTESASYDAGFKNGKTAHDNVTITASAASGSSHILIGSATVSRKVILAAITNISGNGLVNTTGGVQPVGVNASVSWDGKQITVSVEIGDTAPTGPDEQISFSANVAYYVE